jgi:hypothetical protein
MICEKDMDAKPVIDLTGPQGNVFVLMGLAKRFAHQLDLDCEQIVREMKAGDYEHAVQTFDKYFGDYVILER